jgi:nitroreductase
MLLLAVACLGDSVSGVPDFERIVSLGAAIQNMLVSATAMGFGSGLTSGQAMNSVALRALFQLSPDESALCFVNIGTVREHKASKRARPTPSDILSTLGK